jgi:hypothetical protein
MERRDETVSVSDRQPDPRTARRHTPRTVGADASAAEAPMSTVGGATTYVGTARRRTVSIDGHAYHVDARTAAMLERVARRADTIGRILIGEITMKFHYDRVRCLLITESDDPRK